MSSCKSHNIKGKKKIDLLFDSFKTSLLKAICTCSCRCGIGIEYQVI